MQERLKFGACVLCRRTTSLTWHHLIPRKLHRRKHFQRHFTRAQLNAGINICRQCHRGLHKLFSEMHLGKELCTLALLQADESVARHVEWVSRQKVAVDRGRAYVVSS
jgi:hypothetical protein